MLHFLPPIGTSQGSRGMIERQVKDIADALGLAMDARDGLAREKPLHRKAPQGNYDARLDQGQLAVQVLTAGHNLIRQWVAVTRWPALDDVGDVDLLSTQVYGAQQLLQVLAGCADKRPALVIFMETRPFTDEHDARVGRPFAWHGISPAPAEGALGADFHLGRDFFQGIIHASPPQNTSPGALRHPHEPTPTWPACPVPPGQGLS